MTVRPEPHRLRWGFSTLGCPELCLAEACQLAAEFHLDALELRSLWGRVDLPAGAAEMGWTPERATKLLARHSLRAVVAGSSFKLVGHDQAARGALVDYCQWAESWSIPHVRVFGGGTWGAALTEANYEQAAEAVQWWRAEKRARQWKVELLLETHDAFSASAPCAALNQRLDEPIGIIWDSHHTWRLGGESPVESWSRLAPWIRHVHFKDSTDQPSARHPYTYVLPGEGQVPLGQIMSVLAENRFAGVVSLEWERLWHPYLPPLREALVQMRKQPWFASSSHESRSALVQS